MRGFTRAELAAGNGKQGAPTYIAYKGKVYDASASYHWRFGRHWITHPAGVEYFDGLDGAPHGEEMLARLPVVGMLVE